MVPDKPFQPLLMFVSKAEAYLSEATIRCFKVGVLALPKDSGPSWKGLPGTNTLAHHEHSKITDVNSFITFGSGTTTIKLFTY
jgi:hypothetical protein